VSRRRGFTLVEVLLAVSLVAALSGGIFGFLWRLEAQRARLERISDASTGATLLIEQVERRLATVFVGDEAQGAGLTGSKDGFRVISRGVSFGPGRGAGSDVVRWGFRWDAGSGELRAGEPGGDEGVLGSGIALIRVRYHDGTRWREEFDSVQAGRLPVAVEIAVWFGEPGSIGTEPGEIIAAPEDEPAGWDAAGFEPDDALLSRGADDADNATEDADPDAAAALSELPEPDRLRVIAVPDAAGQEDSGAAEALTEGGDA